MIKEDYCSYEVAKILKEKSFNESCYTCYVEKEISHYDYSSTNYELIDGVISCPTIQMTMKWLREIHNKHCDIGYDIDLHWFFQIIDLKETIEYDYPETKYYHTENETGFNSYEEAVEAALKYVLENLI